MSRHLSGISPNDKDDAGHAFEPLEQSQADSQSTSGSIDSKRIITPTSRLSPKSLPLRSATHAVRTAASTGIPVIITIFGLIVFAASLCIFVPNTRNFAPDLAISCDLATNQGNKFQNAFTINLRGATHLTYTEAKAVDIVWQLLMGAGGRFAMAWISYRVFMDGLARLAEQTPISYTLYASLTFSTTSLFAVWTSFKAVFFLKGWRIKCFLLWFTMSTIYVLGFPTLMSATGGYLSPSTAGFNMTDGTFLPPDSTQLRSCYEVSAGALIGYSNGTIAEGPPVSVFDVVKPDDRDCAALECVDELYFRQNYPLFTSLLNATLLSECPFGANDTLPCTQDTENQCPLMGSSDFNTNITNNITIEGRLYTFGDYCFDEKFGSFQGAYCYNNKTIPDLEGLAQCLPANYFVWGFSSLMIYVNLSLFMAWILGMYLVWVDARICSALCRSGRTVRGHFRAVADLSEAMREVLGDETCAYSDWELARELSRQPGLTYYASHPQDGGASHIGLSSISRKRVPFDSTNLYGKVEENR